MEWIRAIAIKLVDEDHTRHLTKYTKSTVHSHHTLKQMLRVMSADFWAQTLEKNCIISRPV